MKALILAAGQGTRLKHLTMQRPKPMLPLSNIPLLRRTVEWLSRYDIQEIAINLHYKSEAITEYFGNGERFGVSLCYSYETALMGTAGAAKQLQSFLTEPFVVIYGDVFTNLDLHRLTRAHELQHEADHSTLLTMSLYQVPNPEECGLVETDANGRVLRFVEKPPRHEVFTNLAFTGVMMCDPTVLDYIPENTPYDFGNNVIPHLLANGKPMHAEPIANNEFVIDIGTLGGYFRALRTAAAQRMALAA